MATCEKCWDDAYMRTHSEPMICQVDHYYNLLKERKENPCTPEEQAGAGATECPKCKRITVHVYAKVCTNCGIKQKTNQ